MIKLFLGVFAAIILTVGCGSTDTKPTDSKSVQTVLNNGESGVLKKDVLVAVDNASSDELWGYINAKNYDAIDRMRAKGTVFLAKQGEKFTVVDRGVLTSKIDVAGKRGLVPTDYLVK